MVKLRDKLEIDNERNVVSIADGIFEYSGHEVNMEPLFKKFKVYRPPSEVVRLKNNLVGLPVTINHVSHINSIDKDKVAGMITGSDVSTEDEHVVITNKVTLNDTGLANKDIYNELSLGYDCEIEQCDNPYYDFVITDMTPHHLAMVESARTNLSSNGKVLCTFKDSEEKLMKNLQEFRKALESLLSGLKDMMGEEEISEEVSLEDSEPTDEKEEDAKVELDDSDDVKEEKDDEEKKDKMKMDDSQLRQEIINDFVKSDSFISMMNDYAQDRVNIINKADKLGIILKDASLGNKELKKEVLEKRNIKLNDSNEINIAFGMLDITAQPQNNVQTTINKLKEEWKNG